MIFDNKMLNIDSFLSELEKRGFALHLKDIISFFSLEEDFFDPYIKEKESVNIEFRKIKPVEV